VRAANEGISISLTPPAIHSTFRIISLL